MDKLEQIKSDIDDLFADTSVSREETASRLLDLREHIDMLRATLDI